MSLSPAASLVSASPQIRVIRDLPYASGPDASPRQRLDLYLPSSEARGAVPVIISAPGGGLVEGDKANDAHIGQRFAQAGFATAVINYRLSPDVSHPGHAEDLAAAVAWVVRSIAAFGGDPNRLFLTGHSAGAYLAALVTTDLRYLSALDVSLDRIRGLIAVSGFYWVDRVAPGRAKHIWGESSEAWTEASPSHHLHRKLPPALFIHADGDDADRRAQNIDFARAAEAAGNAAASSVEIAERDHRSLWKRIADAGDPLAEGILAFVRAHA